MTDAALPVESVRFPDGSLIVLRPIGIRDGRLLSNFLTQLSPESEYRRFLSAGRAVRARWVARLINADQVGVLVYGAFAADRFGSSLVAVAESIRVSDDPERAEFAIAAVDPWQNMGIGSLLAGFLADVARGRGVRYWESYMLAENHHVGKVLARLGRRVEMTIDSGISTAVYDLGPEPVPA